MVREGDFRLDKLSLKYPRDVYSALLEGRDVVLGWKGAYLCYNSKFDPGAAAVALHSFSDSVPSWSQSSDCLTL